MKSKCLNKKQFIDVLNALRDQNDKDNRIDAFFRKELPNADFCANEIHSGLWYVLIRLLTDSFPQNAYSINDIDYFVYEIDFGRKYKEGDVKDANGKIIDFSTAEKLWDYLTEEYHE